MSRNETAILGENGVICIPPDNRILKRSNQPEADKPRTKVSVKPNRTTISKTMIRRDGFLWLRIKPLTCSVQRSLMCFKQLIVLKSGHPAPYQMFTENCWNSSNRIDKRSWFWLIVRSFCRSGETGRRAGLKIQWTLCPCEFDSRLRHQ